MNEPAPNAELLRALGRLVRGLSALFWGLPSALIVCFYTATARAEALRSLGVLPSLAAVPPLAATGLLLYGLWLLGDFQKQERIWRNALDRARLLALVDFGLSPFLFWYNQIPANAFFLTAVVALVFSALLFLGSLNLVLRRLGAMLPDETLRQETRQFTAVNLNLLGLTLLLTGAYLVLGQVEGLPRWVVTLRVENDLRSLWFLVLLVLLPLAMTMALVWKTKEVILDSVFGAQG